MKHGSRAFTLIEFMIVTAILAILTSGIVVSLNAGRSKAKYRDHQNKIVNMYQTARALSTSNRLLTNVQAEYYHVNLSTGTIYLEGVDIVGTPTLIDQFDFDPAITIDNPFDIYYYTPFGKACFTLGCPGGTDIKQFTINSDEIDYNIDIAVTYTTGFPEVIGGDI